ncbi:MAG: CPBP family intramembrane glutamic endopeptidase [Promethearchaeati archaeon]
MKMKEIDFKVIIKIIIVMFLITPIFFGFSIEYLFPWRINIINITLIISGIFILYLLSYLTVRYQINQKIFDIMKDHEVVNAFLESKYFVIFTSFLVTIIMEELIFRFYIIGVLIHLMGPIYVILISSSIFSLYHLHIWFSHHNKAITFLYIGYSFLLGLLNAYVFLNLGIFFAILIHYILALIFYFEIAIKFKNIE